MTKKKNIISLNNQDILQIIKKHLIMNMVSFSYQKRVIILFQNFIEYIFFIKKNKELINNFKVYNRYIVKRIKIKDIEDFILYKY